MNKYLRLLKLRKINVYIFRMKSSFDFEIKEFPYVIKSQKVSNNKIRYYITHNNKVIHESFFFRDVFLLGLINKRKSPVIGDCFTDGMYRGQNLYPYVINKISNEILNSDKEAVYIIVDNDNQSSIRGIEKAGFEKYAQIKAKRWLWIYLNKAISYFSSSN